jgi:hypothetical protein
MRNIDFRNLRPSAHSAGGASIVTVPARTRVFVFAGGTR